MDLVTSTLLPLVPSNQRTQRELPASKSHAISWSYSYLLEMYTTSLTAHNLGSSTSSSRMGHCQLMPSRIRHQTCRTRCKWLDIERQYDHSHKDLLLRTRSCWIATGNPCSAPCCQSRIATQCHDIESMSAIGLWRAVNPPKLSLRHASNVSRVS